MRIKEENRNIVLLATVTAVCGLVAGTAALLEPTSVPSSTPWQRQIADDGSGGGMAPTPVRVVGGTVFVPNVNPRER